MLRAICESCAKPQPRDWRPGDLCVHCGRVARREVRCYWCARWTPAAKYCRKCGADVLEDPTMFAPARMLKDAGTDRFTIPKLLREFDADRLATFRAIYQSQAAIASAHVSDLEYVETFLYQRVWSSELDDRLTSQLPWPDGQALEHTYYEGDGRLAHIAGHSPIPITRDLAALALLRQDDWNQHRIVTRLIFHDDLRVREESALALSHWRVLTAVGLPRDLELEVERILAKSSFEEPSKARLAHLFPQKYELNPTLLASSDSDVRFTAALTACDADVLRVTASSGAPELSRYAAFLRLASADGIDAQTAKALGDLDEEHASNVLGTLAQMKRPFSDLTSPLLELISRTPSARVRDRAANLLSRDISYETALAVFNIDGDLAPILFRSNMPPEAFEDICGRLLESGKFRASMYGMDAAAQPGRMPGSFVPARFQRTPGEELILFAERQLEASKIAPLMDFLVRCCFEAEGRACVAAWSATSRLQRGGDPAAVTPFVFEAAAVNRIFGSMQRFLDVLIQFLRRLEWRDDVLIFDPLSRFLRYPDDNVFASVCGCASADEYVSTILEVLRSADVRGTIRTDCFYPLIGVATACPTLRSRIEAELQALAAGPDFVYQAQYSLERIAALTSRPAETQ